MDEKEPNLYGKLLLHMCNSTSMLNKNGVYLCIFMEWIDGFTCRKHSGVSVIDCMLLLVAIMYGMKSFDLANGSQN